MIGWQYACIVWHWHQKRVMWADENQTLEEFVQSMLGGEDEGLHAIEGFYEHTDNGWEWINVEDIKAQYERDQRERWKTDHERWESERWEVVITGPEDVTDVWSSSFSRDEAEAKMAKLPPYLRPTVKHVKAKR